MNQFIKFANNASVRVAEAVRVNDTKIHVAAGDTTFFPTIEKNGEHFILCLVNSSTGAFEIVKCIGIEGNDTFVVKRAQENTTAKFFPVGSLIENRLTAGSIQNIFNHVKASSGEAGLVYVATSEDIDNGNIENEPVVPTVDAMLEYGFITGGIVAFSGKFINGFPVPKGKSTANMNWHICDGTYGTPDLNDRFIQGTTNTENIGKIGGSNKMTGTTGPCTLTTNQMPSHAHGMEVYWGYRDAAWATDPSVRFWLGMKQGTTYAAGGSASHTHPLSASTDNRPAYYTLAYIMKIK